MLKTLNSFLESVRDSYLENFHQHQDGLKAMSDQLGLQHHLISIDTPLEHTLHHYITNRSALGGRVERKRNF